MSSDRAAETRHLGSLGVLRLGLVQASIGSIVVLVVSTLNRVMVVEYAWPALLPGSLVALHYAVQLTRTRYGYRADRGGRATPRILRGMAVLAAGGLLCAVATVSLAAHPIFAVALGALAYTLVGLGVGAAGTSLLILASARTDPHRRAGAATSMWILMIAGFAVTSSVVGHFLDPFSPRRLLLISAVVVLSAFCISVGAVFRVEDNPRGMTHIEARRARARAGFGASLRAAWCEPHIRNFTWFVLLSMLAYSAQELLLEPFAGLVFSMTLGASAKLSGLWHASMLAGMIGLGLVCRGRRHDAALQFCTFASSGACAVAVASLAFAALVGPRWPLPASVVALGVANGVFAVSAVASMMTLAHRGGSESAGLRMGLWGAAQAVGFAVGGLLATSILDASRHLLGSPSAAFAVVFGMESAMFLVAGMFAARVAARSPAEPARVAVEIAR
jgi:MFS transporter, BCD family, chlorophyll transporter